MKKLFIISIILCFINIFNISFWYSDFWENVIEYQKYIEIRNNLVRKFNFFDKSKLQNIKNKVKNQKCYQYKIWEDYILSPICLLNWQIPKLSMQDALKTSWQYVDAFDNSYDLKRKYFEYHWANPIFENKVQNLLPLYDYSIINEYLLISLNYKNIMIKIPKNIIAINTMKDFSYYVVWKDLWNQWKCWLQNYMVAYNSLDNLILKPWEKFNINKHISYLPWYCHIWRYKEPFYGWVCWASTQLFRVALLSPDLNIIERENHSKRRVYYYAEYIYWDDAGIYWDIKNLTIKNEWDKSIMFKTLSSKDRKYNYLVWISSQKSNKYTMIKKEQTWPLSAEVKKTIMDKNSMTESKNKVFVSKYKKKHYWMN